MTKPLSWIELNNRSNYLYAEPNDIGYEINDTLCLCNLENECFNIGIEVLKSHNTTCRDVLRFIYILYTEYNINYISVRERTKWPFLKHFKYFKDEKTNIIYIKISENINQIKKELKI